MGKIQSLPINRAVTVSSLAFLAVHLAGKRKPVSDREELLAKLNTWFGLVRNGLCVLQDLRPALLQDVLPSPEGFTPLSILISANQLAGFVLNTYIGLQAFLRARADAFCTRRWLDAARKLPTQEGEPGRAMVVKRLEAKLAGCAMKMKHSACKMVAGGGMFFLWSLTNKWLAFPTVAKALTVMLASLIPVLTDASANVRATLRACATATKVLDGVEPVKPEAVAGPAAQYLAHILEKQPNTGLVLCVANAPCGTPDDLHCDILNEDCKRAQDNYDQLHVAITSTPPANMVQRVRKAIERARGECKFDKLIIGLNWAAFAGYFQILITYYVPDESRLGPLWPGHALMADWGNFLGDVCWTVEPFLCLFYPNLFQG